MRSTKELQIWTPRLKIREEVSEKPPKRLEKMKLMKSKTIFVNQEVMKKLSCPMDFDKFPFDVQKCNFSMFDALNYADTLVFVDETKYIHDISENSKYYVKVEGLNYTTTWKGHSLIGFNLILTRKTHIYLASIYLPSAMFVVMSWLRYGIFLSS